MPATSGVTITAAAAAAAAAAALASVRARLDWHRVDLAARGALHLFVVRDVCILVWSHGGAAEVLTQAPQYLHLSPATCLPTLRVQDKVVCWLTPCVCMTDCEL